MKLKYEQWTSPWQRKAKMALPHSIMKLYGHRLICLEYFKLPGYPEFKRGREKQRKIYLMILCIWILDQVIVDLLDEVSSLKETGH